MASPAAPTPNHRIRRGVHPTTAPGADLDARFDVLQNCRTWVTPFFEHGFHGHVFDKLAFTRFDKENRMLVAELEVEPRHANAFQNAHGGVLAALIDIVSSFAIVESGHPTSGVSSDLSTSYLKSAPVGSVLEVRSYCERVGKNLAFTRTDVFDKATGELLASGRHTKFCGGDYAMAPKL
ncbi:Acyl-coenzyme A thioesterase 13 [Allomyces javanicus]|nr:Acyl-coenzyme A thioesterase 13 [Allomyces javanicus]